MALASAGVGIGIGVLADKFIFSDKDEEDDYEKDPNAFLDYIDEDGVRHIHYDLDDEDVKDALGMEVYEDLDIPKGVNMIEDVASNLTDKASKLFVKPDLNKYIDYTKYQDMAKNYSTDVPKEEPVEEFIHVIDEEEFVKETGNEDGYISVTASYFTQEKILAGWNDDLIEREPSETVGEKSRIPSMLQLVIVKPSVLALDVMKAVLSVA